MEVTILIFSLVTLAAAQRPSFAGTRPIGYPEVTTEGLIDKFGEDGTTQRLPLEANGDRDLVDRLSKLPIDKQPFWFINWQALQAHREQGVQTYPQKPNQFIDPIPNTGSNNVANSNPSNSMGGSNSNSNFANSNSQLSNSNSNFPNSNSQFPNSNTNSQFPNSNINSQFPISNTNSQFPNSNVNSQFPNSNSNFPNSNSNFANSNSNNGIPPSTNVNNNSPGSPVQADLLNRFGEENSSSGTGSSNSKPSMTSSFGAQNVNVMNVIPTTKPAPVRTTQSAPYYYQ